MCKVKINAANPLYEDITSYLLPQLKAGKNLVFLCIGSDRATGDCLGPITGTELSKYQSKQFKVCGSIENPIHSKNLQSTLDKFKFDSSKDFVVVIDACLSCEENVGKIFVRSGSMYPGRALNKKIKPIGDLSILGIVNEYNIDNFKVLQNTPLSRVIKLAEMITTAINQFINENTSWHKLPAGIF